jgi:ATP-dependent RNA helicase DHX37/DHR1
LHKDFEKEIQRKKIKEEKRLQEQKNQEEAQKTPKTAQPQISNLSELKGKSALITNQLGKGVNLFDVKSFQAEENFDHLKVVPIVDEEALKRQEISQLIKAHDKYTLENPFQGTIQDFIEGNALSNVEDYVDEDRDIYLKEFLNIESDILVKINQYDQLDPKIKPAPIKRAADIAEVKSKLPVTLKEFEIMESVINNLVTIVCGATGSGKSTQIPQFLYETGFCSEGHIGITQPRRLAAISLAQRVAEEMASQVGGKVGYQVRFEASKFTDETKIKFMTDGILLNEMMSDFLLTKYSVIVLDEAHERKINTDLLIGLLSRVIRIRAKLSLKERENSDKIETNSLSTTQTGGPRASKFKMNPLRLIIMSATLRTSDFTANKYLFPEEKINTIEVEARMFPVKVIHERETMPDYVEECIEKIVKIHTQLPPGGLLVFLTGEEEIRYVTSEVQSRLEEAKRKGLMAERVEEDMKPEEFELHSENEDEQAEKMIEEPLKEPNPEEKLAEKEENVAAIGRKKDTKVTNKGVIDYVVYPLYTKLPMAEQQKIFKHASSEKRLIVISTNVAETSLTIPNVKYVVDCGKEKKKVYNAQMTLGRFEIDWISQSSAKQREGRAGRTCAGYCYRLFSQAVYNKFQEFSDPEIVKEPLDSSILTLKTIGIHDIERFPFVTRPGEQNISKAVEELTKIGALGLDLKITELGSSLSQMPIKPRLGKMLLMARKAHETVAGILMAAALSTEEIFDTRELKEELSKLSTEEEDENSNKRLKKNLLAKHKSLYHSYINEKSDLITEANIIGNFISTVMKAQKSHGVTFNLNTFILKFCREGKLLFKSMRETYSLILHLLKIVDTIVANEKEKEEIKLKFEDFQPTIADKNSVVFEIIVATMIDKVARRIRYLEEGREKQAFETTEHNLKVQVHPSSFVFSRRPNFLIYNEVIQSSEEKIFLARVTEIDNLALLAKYDPSQDRKIEKIADPTPLYSITMDCMMHYARCTFGIKLWEIDYFLTEYLDDPREKYAYFCYALLQGKVLPGFKVLKEKLKTKLPDKILQEPKILQPLIAYLQKHKVASKQSFLQDNKKNQGFKVVISNLVEDKYKQKVLALWHKIIGSGDEN